MKEIKIKRIYDDPSTSDGCRILIDRLWPRGVSKEDAQLDEWDKDIAPTADLRKWFDHDPEKFAAFADKYLKELDENKEGLEEIREKAKAHVVTLLYGAKDTKHNHAVVLQKKLKE